METGVFVDTWGWIEGYWEDAPRYDEISDLFSELDRTGVHRVTTNCVLLELCGATAQRGLRREALVALYKDICDSDNVDVVHIGKDDQQAAFERYFEPYTDKAFSLVDCISFLVMQRLEVVRVVTDDRDFAQVGLGFELLPGDHA